MAGSVDVTTTLQEFEHVLQEGTERERCFELLAVLWRWQRDPDLTEESRRRAGELVRKYGKQYANVRG